MAGRMLIQVCAINVLRLVYMTRPHELQRQTLTFVDCWRSSSTALSRSMAAESSEEEASVALMCQSSISCSDLLRKVFVHEAELIKLTPSPA